VGVGLEAVTGQVAVPQHPQRCSSVQMRGAEEGGRGHATGGEPWTGALGRHNFTGNAAVSAALSAAFFVISFSSISRHKSGQ
jgi:hypothetical protein